MDLGWQLRIRCTYQELPVKVCMDDSCQEIVVGTQSQTVAGHIDDYSGLSHRLTVHLEHKLPEHTVQNELGDIIQDRVITIESFEIDGLDFTPILYRRARYQHDHNGYGPLENSPLVGSMGWNGVVTLDFSSPIYVWLIRHETD